MIEDESSSFLSDMREHVDSSYFLYKVCEGCDCLLMYERNVCPNCNAYRFNTSRSVVVPALLKLIEREYENLHDLRIFGDEFI